MAIADTATDYDRFTQTTEEALRTSVRDDVELIQQLVVEHLKKGPKVDEAELTAHIGAHFSYVFPAVVFDPRAKEAIIRLLDAYDAGSPPPVAAPTPAPASDGPGQSGASVDFPYGAAALGAGAAAIAGYYILEHIAHYCGDVHPEPGTSAATHC